VLIDEIGGEDLRRLSRLGVSVRDLSAEAPPRPGGRGGAA
jgi:hypothetical protein